MLNPIWAIVPAAGVGSRMQAAIPKQYLTLGHQCVLAHTLDKLLNLQSVERVVVAVAENDSWFNQTILPHPKLTVVAGGSTRAASVLNALNYVRDNADNPWVLVHDAARPCVRTDNVQRLIDAVLAGSSGGLLAVPAADTLKLVEGGTTKKTIDRTHIWHAHTPQMFRTLSLIAALEMAFDQNFEVTDEASAVEFSGGNPLVVADARDNIKITQPEDLLLAEWLITQQNI